MTVSRRTKKTKRPKTNRRGTMANVRRTRTIFMKRYEKSAKPKHHRKITNASSPEVLHAIISRIKNLPSQPLIQFTPEGSFEIPLGVKVHFAEMSRNTVSNAEVSGIKLPTKASAQSKILTEALNPTGGIFLNDTDAVSFSINISKMFVHSQIRDAVREDYTDVDPWDIPIFFAIEMPPTKKTGIAKLTSGHMSMIVLHRAVVYSLGFGYGGGLTIGGIPISKGKTIGPGAFYSPDAVINARDILERNEEKYVYKYNIVDMGYLTPIHVERLMKLAELSTGRGNIEFSSGTFDSTTLLINSTYAAISWNPFTCLTKGMLNCTTFIEYVFRERVNCQIAGKGVFGLVSMPSFCERVKGKLKKEHIINWYKEYANGANYSPETKRILLGEAP